MIFKGHRPWERERLGWKNLGRDEKNSYFDYHKESFKERDLVEGKKKYLGSPCLIIIG